MCSVKIFYKIHSKHFKAFNYKTIGKSNIKIAIKKEHLKKKKKKKRHLLSTRQPHPLTDI